MADLTDKVEHAKAILSEHSDNYVIIAQDPESGDISYEYSTFVGAIGLMVLANKYILNDVIDEGIETIWEEEELDDPEQPEF